MQVFIIEISTSHRIRYYIILGTLIRRNHAIMRLRSVRPSISGKNRRKEEMEKVPWKIGLNGAVVRLVGCDKKGRFPARILSMDCIQYFLKNLTVKII